MATRLYLATFRLFPNPEIAPDAAWDDLTISEPLMLALHGDISIVAQEHGGTDPKGFTNTGVTVAGPANALVRALRSPPLDVDQTIAGTVTGQIRASQSHVNANAMVQMGIRVVAPDGSIRGTLLALHTEALSSEVTVGATQTNRTLPLAALSPATLTSVDALAGDRIIVELGLRKTEAGTTSRNYNMSFGTTNITDLPVNETDTAGFSPWIQFSQDLTFGNPGPRLSSLMMAGMGA